jgi:hypothetical protein
VLKTSLGVKRMHKLDILEYERELDPLNPLDDEKK